MRNRRMSGMAGLWRCFQASRYCWWWCFFDWLYIASTEIWRVLLTVVGDRWRARRSRNYVEYLSLIDVAVSWWYTRWRRWKVRVRIHSTWKRPWRRRLREGALVLAANCLVGESLQRRVSLLHKVSLVWMENEARVISKKKVKKDWFQI